MPLLDAEEPLAPANEDGIPESLLPLKLANIVRKSLPPHPLWLDGDFSHEIVATDTCF